MTTHLPDETASPLPSSVIQVRGVRVHNLKNIDLDIPLNQLIAVCGVSGSGKTSLAFDTLYAEGQRRYLETLSPSARQYLNQLPKPDADQITQIPPAIALRQNTSQRHFTSRGRESTAGIESGIQHYLRLLFTASGQIFCPDCQIPISPQSPESVLALIKTLPAGIRYQICYPVTTGEQSLSEIIQELKQQGLNRVILHHEEYQLADDLTVPLSEFDTEQNEILVVLDRLTTRSIDDQRILESLEFAFTESSGQATLIVMEPLSEQTTGTPFQIGQQQSFRFDFSTDLFCPQCRREFAQPEPQLFNFFSPSGACSHCGGSGIITESSSISSAESCPHCQGSRLNPSALAVFIHELNIHQLGLLPIQQITAWLKQFKEGLGSTEAQPLAPVLREIGERLSLLNELGLGYLTLNRTRSTLSSGEIQRTALTSLLSSNLVNTLYVLDEPSSGLHPADSHRVISVLQKLRQLNNTLLIVEHDAAFIRAAEQIIELGPEAGKAGGEVVFSGSLEALMSCDRSPTSRFLNAAEIGSLKSEPDRQASEWITLTDATQNNLQSITVKFPLRQLCVVTGISGSGKSSLIEQTLFPLLAAQLSETQFSPIDYGCQSLSGADQIDEVILLDHSLTGQNPRSIPATYLNLFDEIRSIFATTPDARLRNLSPGHFSFNSKSGGRCPVCKGTGKIEIDLQFLADLTMDCQECHGKRYQRELLEIKYRKLNIAEVLELTVDEAFPFFRGQPALQRKLKQLKDVGLGYLPLGQPLPTLSGGECQRLKLAAYLNTSSRNKTLFLMNEPTRGLHPLDIQYVLNCFNYLLTAGHSIILNEHNLDLIRAADHIIDLGPEAGAEGGHIVVTGTPAEVAAHPTSYTGQALNQKFS
ncbi:excinuclease ABC subunit UvrA [Gimesia algae]|uniref:UvrABC system protein A n=1 Tax=Gimesia algae TaxID=2527971 RepID=A0A517V8S7_9PLAN|nr:excinuclease ABC subunit UvrA [Gimesia algae]QDT89411.1 UvrABC system protein A [Gimesia algae]